MMMMMMIDKVFQLKHTLVWIKNNHVLGRADYCYKHEPILFGWRKGKTHKFYGGFNHSVFEYDKPLKNDLHPTMKPVPLVANLIQNSTQQDDICIDFFVGSGTTLVACEQLGRRGYGIELSPQYCQVTIDRLLRLNPDLEVKKNGEPYRKTS